MYKLFLLSILIILKVSSYGQIKTYRLIDKTNGANIDYNRLQDLNIYSSGYALLNSVFKPIEGKYKVYRFVSTYKGLSHRTEKTEFFHDIIVLETDVSNHIVDAYQYTLEWSEMPLTLDLYKMSNIQIILKNHMDIGLLRFKQVPDLGDIKQKRILLKENGYLEF